MISVFTPSNNAAFLNEAYASLRAQTETDWEWVIVWNGAGDVPVFHDARVRVIPWPYGQGSVGALKHYAASQCRGDVVVEFDHDDLLTPDALAEIAAAFEDESVDFAYSNFAQVDADWNPQAHFSAAFGWQYRPYCYEPRGVVLQECVSPEPLPQSISRIWYAPNHVRAWRKSFYDRIGGHDISLPICDDHDLMCRTYIEGRMHHIDKCLSIYRVHGNNTWLQRQDAIQVIQWQVYDKYIFDMAARWARDNGLSLIDLCGAINTMPGYQSIDRQNADILCDLNGEWALPDNSVGVLRANDAIEHLRDRIHTMNEAWRVLAHGGFFLIDVPDGAGKGFLSDPTHCAAWVDRSFRYYTEAGMRAYIEPECHCRFQVIKVENLTKYEDAVPYVRAHLIAIKDDAPRFHGELLV